jgi:uncharacterized protein (TIGR03067 family)
MNVVVLLGLLVASDGVNQDSQKELAKLQGMWKGTSVEVNGQTQTGPLAEGYRFAVLDDTCTFSSLFGTLRPNLSRNEMDLIATEGPRKGTTHQWLYQIKDDELRIAIDSNGIRPKKLETDDRTRHSVYIFQRDPTYSKEQTAEYLKKRKEDAAVSAQRFAQRALKSPATQEQLKQVLDKLESMDKRLEALEKKLNEKK